MATKRPTEQGALARLRQAISDALQGSMAQTAASTVGIKAGLPGPIGINFGASSLKLLQVVPGNPPSLVGAACLETPEELLADPEKRLQFQMNALPKLIKAVDFKGRRAVCSIPPYRTICKPMQFTRQDGLEVGQLVDGAIAMQFNCDPSAVVYRYYEINTGDKPGPKVDVLVIATPRVVVEQLMKGLLGAKLQPVGMHSEFAAMLRAFDYTNRRDGDLNVNTLYIDVGSSTTTIAIAHGMELAFARVVTMGGRSIDEAIARAESVTEREVRERRKKEASVFTEAPAPVGAVGGEGAEVSSDRRQGVVPAPGFTPEVQLQPEVCVGPASKQLNEVMEAITDEIRLCLRYHTSQFPQRKVERVVFLGGEAQHRGLCQHIARALRLPAQTADPMARVARTGSEPTLGVDLHGPQPGWAVALGLCLAPTDL